MKRKLRGETATEEDINKTWKLFNAIMDPPVIKPDPCVVLRHYCPNCLSTSLVNNIAEGEVVCSECGNVKHDRVVYPLKKADKNDKKQAYDNYVVKDSSYKRRSHYNEVVAQSKGYGGTVEDDVVQGVKRYALQIGKVPKNLSSTEIRDILKQMNKYEDNNSKYWTKFYEQVPQIYSLLTGTYLPWLEPRDQERMDARWTEAEQAWERAPLFILTNKRGRRTSFINYRNFMVLQLYVGFFNALRSEIV